MKTQFGHVGNSIPKTADSFHGHHRQIFASEKIQSAILPASESFS